MEFRQNHIIACNRKGILFSWHLPSESVIVLFSVVFRLFNVSLVQRDTRFLTKMCEKQRYMRLNDGHDNE